MLGRIGAVCLCVCLVFGACVMPAAAEETTTSSVTSTTAAPAEKAFSLLSAEATIGDPTATAVYTAEGALSVTATEAGATVAVEFSQEIDLETMRYLQLSVNAQVPFNLALKLSGAEYDLYPQIKGPSWYEAFQGRAPSADEGVAAGEYTMSLDVRHYADYNGLALREDGTTTLKSVYLTLYAPGTVTVSHLKLGESASFTTADGKSGTAATTVAPITTHSDTTKLPTKYAYYDGGDIAAIDDTIRREETSPAPMIAMITVGVLLVAAMILLTVLKKRRERISLEEETED